LIASRLTTPPQLKGIGDNDSSMESTNKVNYKRKKTASVSKTSKANETTTKELQLIKIELATNQSMQSEQGSQAIVMPHEHSMFLQCIPATREQLGPDILAKV